ncbi:MAG TPA: DUF3293 domain-containing protein [Gemmatimonadaceae bacterium]|nr:DUF3293 domain-containing protein [Gemmatimonadaceae bacterium]
MGTGPRVEIDLRRPLTEGDRVALRALGLTGAFAIITADNPLGQHAPDSHNEVAEETLEAHIRRLGVRYVPATGCSPDRSHCEDGFAVELHRRAAREVAEEFRQDALFWYDGKDFWLDGAVMEMEPVGLPLVEGT